MTDTIAAIATATGISAINIIKVSGNDAVKIVNKIFKGTDLTKVSSFTMHYGFIVDNDEKIDEVLVSVFLAPKSYTGENVVEINSHGGIACTNRILELLLTNGCRLAMPGEFLKRAFLNGKKDLLEAESISDLIEAQNESARKMGMKGATGELSKKIKSLKEKLINIIANIEVNIDYPEYEDAIVYTNDLLEKSIREIKNDLKKLLDLSQTGKIIKDGINIGIIGKPNVGKSSLLNILLEEEKAIVTDIEGTTRDIVEGTITIDGVKLNLTDTAGIRETDNIVEKIGVEKSKKIINESDLIIAIFDGSREFSKEDEDIIEEIKDKKVIALINKDDLDLKIDINRLSSFEKIYTSFKNNKGIKEIYNKIKELFNLEQINQGDYTYLSNSRQISVVKNAIKIANDIYEANSNQVPVDLIQIDIQNLWETLSELTGDSLKEEMLDEIFSKFCLGK